MHHKNIDLGLILGGGMLTKTLIHECKKQKKNIYIIAIEEDFKLENIEPDIKINFNRLGNIFSYLKNKNVSHVVLLGSIKKKPLLKIRPNLITFIYLIKLLLFYKRDGKLIDKIVKLFENKNINVVDPRIFLKNNLCSANSNNLNKFKKYLNRNDIKYYFKLAKKNWAV